MQAEVFQEFGKHVFCRPYVVFFVTEEKQFIDGKPRKDIVAPGRHDIHGHATGIMKGRIVAAQNIKARRKVTKQLFDD